MGPVNDGFLGATLAHSALEKIEEKVQLEIDVKMLLHNNGPNYLLQFDGRSP